MSHCPCCGGGFVQPSFQCKAVSPITFQLQCSAADSQSHNTTQSSDLLSAHQTVLYSVLLLCEQNGCVEWTGDEADSTLGGVLGIYSYPLLLASVTAEKHMHYSGSYKVELVNQH